MTTIVGLYEEELGARIYADVRLSNDGLLLGTTRKIIKVTSAYQPTVIAVSGSAAVITAYRYIINNELEAVAVECADTVFSLSIKLHEYAREYGLNTESDLPFSDSHCQMLVGNKFGLWAVLNNREVVTTNMYAIGSGREFALGALAYGSGGGSAIEIASRYDLGTSPEHDYWGSK